MLISTADARGLVTKKLVQVYSTRKAPTKMFSSFFKKVETGTLAVSIEVQRGTDIIAIDVERGTEGNRNKFDSATEKLFTPPFFNEFFDVTEVNLYDNLFVDSYVDMDVVAKFINNIADKYMQLQDKIERSIEKLCADALEYGTIQLYDGTLIPFGRKAGSFPNAGPGNYWANGATDPFAQIRSDVDFVRAEAMIESPVYNLICGSQAFDDLYKNTTFLARQDLVNLKTDNIVSPQLKAPGAYLHGSVTAGSYKVQLWTYTGQYRNKSNVLVPYMNPKKTILLPETTDFTLAFGGIAQIAGDNNESSSLVIDKRAFSPYKLVDPRKVAIQYGLKSAPIPIITAVDTIVTRTVVA
jgi:uncharacterized alkaline shock family protein YloU